MRISRTSLSLLVVLMACGGNGVDREDFDTELARAVCERYARCGVIEDVPRCQQRQLVSGFVSEFGLGSRYDTALEEDRVSYDDEAAWQCVEFIRTGSCEAPLLNRVMHVRGIEYDSPCRFIQGEVEDGESCQRTTECADGGSCDVQYFTCGGVCRRGPHPASATFEACPPGTLNLRGTCRKPLGPGETCLAGDEIVGDCDQGLNCTEWLGDSKWGCRPLRAEGEACDEEWDPCQDSLRCIDDVCQRLRGEGEPCRNIDSSRSTRECRDELFCDADFGQQGICRPRRGTGACRIGSECGDGLYCPGSNFTRRTWGTCEPAAARGESCSDRGCDYGLLCSFATETCQRSARLGERCEDRGSCEYSGFCVEGFCQQRLSGPCP